MKTTRSTSWMAVCAAVLTATTAFHVSAEQLATAARPEKSYTGTVLSVDPKEHVLSVKGWGMWSKTFNLGDNCTYMLLEKNNATANDLRPGEKVVVSYQDAHGVLIADRVEQRPVQFVGVVKAVDPDKHTLLLHRPAFDKQLQIADDCKITLRDGKSGTFADIRVGNHVTVTYETPDNKPTAREIAQTSIAFTGKLTAVDLEDKTVKAKSGFDSKKFMVANDCAIMINGKPDGRLGDLKPNDRLVFNYDEINGVNVVNRIAPAEAQTSSVANTTAPMAGN
ncbi:MAG: hypothetical protein PHY43_15125 [Verrucomicrobiales bacterium]|nr:hypothetical protein [Verrucomicrobiales bacterium]